MAQRTYQRNDTKQRIWRALRQPACSDLPSVRATPWASATATGFPGIIRDRPRGFTTSSGAGQISTWAPLVPKKNNKRKYMP